MPPGCGAPRKMRKKEVTLGRMLKLSTAAKGHFSEFLVSSIMVTSLSADFKQRHCLSTGHYQTALFFPIGISQARSTLCALSSYIFWFAAPAPAMHIPRAAGVFHLYIGLTLSDANIANGTPFFNSQNPWFLRRIFVYLYEKHWFWLRELWHYWQWCWTCCTIILLRVKIWPAVFMFF